MSFRQKQAAITLLAIWIVGLTLLFRLIRADPSSMDEALPLLAGAGIAMIAVMTLAHIGLVIGAGREEARQGVDERDHLIDLAGRRNGYWFAMIGLSLVVIQAIRGVTTVGLAETAIAAFLVAEAVVYGSRLYYYGRGL
jgi:hypothetical protein